MFLIYYKNKFFHSSLFLSIHDFEGKEVSVWYGMKPGALMLVGLGIGEVENSPTGANRTNKLEPARAF
jgi:hypothetical protein